MKTQRDTFGNTSVSDPTASWAMRSYEAVSLQTKMTTSKTCQRTFCYLLTLTPLPTYVNPVIWWTASNQKIPRNFLRFCGSRLSSSRRVIVLILSWYRSAAASDLFSAASALYRNSFTCSRNSLRSWVTASNAAAYFNSFIVLLL